MRTVAKGVDFQKSVPFLWALNSRATLGLQAGNLNEKGLDVLYTRYTWYNFAMAVSTAPTAMLLLAFGESTVFQLSCSASDLVSSSIPRNLTNDRRQGM